MNGQEQQGGVVMLDSERKQEAGDCKIRYEKLVDGPAALG